RHREESPGPASPGGRCHLSQPWAGTLAIMRNRHRVVWTKGMFLTPQHFQTQDQYLENALQFRFAASLFANWGVTGLNIDSEALGNGLFRVNDCKGILPDGEPFDIPDTDEPPPSRSVTDRFPPTWDT